MNFKLINSEIENFRINNQLGVSPYGGDTKLLASFAEKEKVKKVLDMGTGTGFIAVYLALKGYNVDASDINLNSLQLARKNALQNKIKINFIYSNLFENITSKYDLIIFNPPMGNISGNKLMELIKSFIPKSNKFLFLNKLGYIFFKNERKKLIFNFLINSLNYLNKKGRIIILMHKKEIGLLKKFKDFLIKVLHKENDYYYIRLEKR